MKKIILASSSPRRKKLLQKLGLKFIVVESKVEETFDEKSDSTSQIKKLSLAKAQAVAGKFSGSLIIAADTIIVFENRIIGKPKDNRDAINILKKLSGKSHQVVTAFTILDTDSKKFISKAAKTKIYFKALTDKEIEDYIETGEAWDKAGAYAIQEGLSQKFVKKIKGDYDNVVGLPLSLLKKELKKFGL